MATRITRPDGCAGRVASFPHPAGGEPPSVCVRLLADPPVEGTPLTENVLDPPGDPITGAYRLLPLGFAAEVTNDDGTFIFRLRGELDMATAPRLARALSTTFDSGPSGIALDLSELASVDSSGLNVFVAASRRAARIGCSFILRFPRPVVLKTLRLTGIDGCILIDIGDAVL